MRRFFEKVLAVTLTLALAMSMSVFAFANELDTPVTPDEPQPQTVGSVIASGAGAFYGSGRVKVYLGTGHSYADIEAGTSAGSDLGSMNITVKFPDGIYHDLGTCYATGGSVGPTEFDYCPSGMYTFYFEATSGAYHNCYARIYEW